MKSSLSRLIKNEIRMLFNQFRLTIKTPSMLFFYAITLFGVFFVSMVLSSLLTLRPLFLQMGSLLESIIDRGMLFAAFSIFSVTSVISGYFGLGPFSGLTAVQENLLLPAPVQPYQVFLSNYFRRIIRKTSFALVGLLAILPLVTQAGLLFYSASFMLICFIVFLETNYFLGAISSYVRLTLQKRINRYFHYFVAALLGALMFLPSLPGFTSTFTLAYLAPSNAFAMVFTEMTGVFSLGVGYFTGFVIQFTVFSITLLFTANICNYDYYELFSTVKSRELNDSNFSRFARGEVDFSTTRFQDPMVWIMLKDFYSRLRSPFQIWKYIYVIVGTAFVLYLNLFHPTWFGSIDVPHQLAFAIVPAFLLMMILLVQMSSISSMLSFVDEKENIYHLKTSPFKPRDIVLAKFISSLIEVGLAVIPACGFLVYLVRIEGYLALIALAAPMTILFTSVGVAVGAYVPVLTNDPRNMPVPLAFSYPVIDLSLGFLMVWIVAALADNLFVLFALPLFSVGFTLFFLFVAVKALNSYR